MHLDLSYDPHAHRSMLCRRWEPVVFMMPMRGALTLGATAQERVEALVMQLAARKVALGTVHHLVFCYYACKSRQYED